ncbi:rrm domain-containing protein [Diaporthe amygdali]|uniref:rrm domain-containing protein n=1 Tax=Phomopsis amygdali TaxID=1214568 RepID=UPI0022FDD45D|nr:rrm domain-containing protein [Diaporthe amygdali]KAJ0123189.1 rrm domain-containing protein [Diaporthe amygdali]
MAEEEFEIDVYGDAQDGGQEHEHGGAEDYGDNVHMDGAQGHDHDDEQGHADEDTQNGSGDQHNDQSASSTSAPQQGVKRKSEPDDRPVDPGATAALLISELQWWNTEDEVRNWVHEADCEDELKDITFSEHKVNGKSKGQAYIELASNQAATATKRHIDSVFGSDENGAGHNQQRRPTVSYHSPGNNPFKTLPKDAPQRARDNAGRGAPAGPGNFNNSGAANNFQAGGGGGGGGFQGGFRGGRGGFNRGGMRGGFNPNYNNSNMNAFNNNMGGGFNNPMGGGGFPGGGFNRGGGMGRGGPGMGAMRGGRGGMMGGPTGMNGMGMGGMPNMGMGGMPNMGMNMMGGMGFNGMPGQFNPGFFGGGNQGGYGGNQAGGGGGGGGDWGNPHGTKRPRGE